MTAPSPDAPIRTPDDDLYGVEPFARALAKSIADMKAPEGIVIGLNGVWGSGKTSALGLVRHHLEPHVKNDEVVIIDFTPWWFTNQEALIRGFFEELGAKIETSLGDKVKGAFRAIGKRVTGLGEAAAAAADAGTGIPGVGAAVKGATGMVGEWVGKAETVVEAQERLARQLGEQKKRFLVIIDDIDRLSPEDALALFRLVKSVGRMPNVIYLLAFDRPLAEKLVKERYPAEGAHYLEKIVQVWFDLPTPTEFDLRQVFLTRLGEITGEITGGNGAVRLMNAFYGVVAHHMKTPRDVVRLLNVLQVSYPPVRGEVDVADFLSIETIRLFQPKLHAVIARNPNMLCGSQRSERVETGRARYDALLLNGEAEATKEMTRAALSRLFPRLESVWNGQGYGEGFEEQWRRERRISSEAHFATYFRFGLSEETMPAAELQAIIVAADDAAAVQGALRKAVGTARRTGGTRAAVLLEELTVNGDKVATEKVPAFLSALFAIADRLNTEADTPAPFEMVDNRLRLHWLMNKLLLRRFQLAERSRIVVEAAKGASLVWIADLAERCAGLKKKQQSNDERLVNDAAADAVVTLAIDRLKQAAKDGSLALSDDVCVLLHRWRRLAGDGEAAGRELVKKNLGDDAFVVRLAAATISTRGVHSSGDLVARRERSVRLDAIAQFVDVDAFLRRVEEVAAKSGHENRSAKILADFRDLPRGDEDRRAPDDD
jgi:predicted KAP-like P-loop ATPase